MSGSGKLPPLDCQQVLDALAKLGFTEVRKTGRHFKAIRRDPYILVPVPFHRPLKPGTLRAILRQAGVTREQFLDALNG